MQTRFDLLLDPFRRVFAVACKLKGDRLEFGALYLEPEVPFEIIRLADKNLPIMDVRLPDEVRNQTDPIKIWDSHLEIVQLLPPDTTHE
jgi:hypothetical protein